MYPEEDLKSKRSTNSRMINTRWGFKCWWKHLPAVCGFWRCSFVQPSLIKSFSFNFLDENRSPVLESCVPSDRTSYTKEGGWCAEAASKEWFLAQAHLWIMQGNCLGDELSWSKAVLLCTAVLLVLQNSWVHIPSSALCLPWQCCSSRRDAAIVNTVLKWMNLGFIILTVSRTHYSSVGAGSHGFLSAQNKLNCACKITCKSIITQSII